MHRLGPVGGGSPVCARAATCPVGLSIPFLPCGTVGLSVVCGTGRLLEAGRRQVPSCVCVRQGRTRTTVEPSVPCPSEARGIASLPCKTPVLSRLAPSPSPVCNGAFSRTSPRGHHPEDGLFARPFTSCSECEEVHDADTAGSLTPLLPVLPPCSPRGVTPRLEVGGFRMVVYV